MSTRKHVTVKVTTPRPEVTIQLDADAASALFMVLGMVGGSPKGPRGLVQEIYDGLELAGVKYDPEARITGDTYLESSR